MSRAVRGRERIVVAARATSSSENSREPAAAGVVSTRRAGTMRRMSRKGHLVLAATVFATGCHASGASPRGPSLAEGETSGAASPA